ncbi:hypothetical protein [Thermococcus sp.]|uniref:hypothetical protein n=1 Tax=Thermococcus sp. TaxID=35749 RepID=UPI0025DD639C|nr:hypothetical protein [Thermococcus sp.]
MRWGRLFLTGLIALLVLASGCTSPNTGTSTHSGSAIESSHSSGIETTSTGTGETPTTARHPTGVQTHKLLNRTVAINASLVPDSVWECSDKAPAIIEGYYSAVKKEENVSGFFDLSVVDEDSLTELHEVLYEAVDFGDLKVENVECFPVSTKLVACKYHYSAVIAKDGQQKDIERNYVTFLSGDNCGIIWTEAEG